MADGIAAHGTLPFAVPKGQNNLSVFFVLQQILSQQITLFVGARWVPVGSAIEEW
jgi:hypothetical protein